MIRPPPPLAAADPGRPAWRPRSPPTPAEAAKRKVPFGFFGTVLQRRSDRAVSDAALDEQMALMARSGVESVRAIIPWSDVEPAQGVYNWARARPAGRHGGRTTGSTLLANVLRRSGVGVSEPKAPSYWTGAPPKSPSCVRRASCRQLVKRYGPQRHVLGAEPHACPRCRSASGRSGTSRWRPGSGPRGRGRKSYMKLLKAAYKAIHKADHGATVVAGSFVAVAGYTQWARRARPLSGGRQALLRRDRRPPVHEQCPTRCRYSIDQMIEIVRRVRAADAQARRRPQADHPDRADLAGGRRQGAEASAAGPGDDAQGTGRAPQGGLQAAGQVRRKLRITQAYWFTWATQYDAKSHAVGRRPTASPG